MPEPRKKKVVRKAVKKKVRKKTRPAPSDLEAEDDAPSAMSLVAGYGKWAIRGLVFGALAIAALIIVPRFLKGREAAGIWEQAVSAHNAGQFEDAIALYKKARDKAPASYTDLLDSFPAEIAKSYTAAGRELQQEGHYVQAAELYQDWIKTDPEGAAAKGAYFLAARSFQMASISDKKHRRTALEYAKLALRQGGGEFSRTEIQRFIERLERKIAEPAKTE